MFPTRTSFGVRLLLGLCLVALLAATTLDLSPASDWADASPLLPAAFAALVTVEDFPPPEVPLREREPLLAAGSSRAPPA